MYMLLRIYDLPLHVAFKTYLNIIPSKQSAMFNKVKRNFQISLSISVEEIPIDETKSEGLK